MPEVEQGAHSLHETGKVSWRQHQAQAQEQSKRDKQSLHNVQRPAQKGLALRQGWPLRQGQKRSTLSQLQHFKANG